MYFVSHGNVTLSSKQRNRVKFKIEKVVLKYENCLVGFFFVKSGRSDVFISILYILPFLKNKFSYIFFIHVKTQLSFYSFK